MTTRTLALAAALSVVLPALARGQATYTVSGPLPGLAPAYAGWTDFSFVDKTGSKTSGDYGVGHLPLPFPFVFYGKSYQALDVTADGLVLFENSPMVCDGTSSTASACGAAHDIPDAAKPNALIALWWDDMAVPNATAQWTVSGTQPNRVFSVRLSGWGTWGSPPKGPRDLQLDLSERSGAIAVYYGALTGTGSDNASVGIEDASGGSGVAGLDCSNAVGRCGSSDWPAGKYLLYSAAKEPDLAVGDVASTPLRPADVGGQPGFQLDLTASVRNQGSQPVAAFDFKVYLSKDPSIDPATDLEVATYSVSTPLAAGAEASYTVSAVRFARPPDAGSYWLGVYADPAGQVAELLESNNAGVGTPYVIGPDLQGDISGPATGAPGDDVALHVVLRNAGTEPAGAFSYEVYLSPDRTLGQAAQRFHVGTVTSLGAGEIVEEPVTAQLPAVQDGAYHLILVVDPTGPGKLNGAVAEGDEGNNVSVAGGQITTSAADLSVKDVKILSTVAPYAETAKAFFGEQVRVSFTVLNLGTPRARDFDVAVLLSDNAVITLYDLPMSPATPVLSHLALEGGEERVVEVDVTVPERSASGALLSDGDYYVGVVVDSSVRVPESNEANNIARAGSLLTVRQPAMDLTPVRVDASSVGAVGEVLPVARVIRNLGKRGNDVVGDPFEYQYVLSSNEIVSLQDIPLKLLSGSTLETYGKARLAPGAEDRRTDLLQLPPDITPGIYYVGLVVDPRGKQPELDEGNNSICSVGAVEVAGSSLRVETAALADGLVKVDYLQHLVASGGDGTYAWSLEPGQGSLPAGISLSAQGVLSGQPAEAGVSVFTVRVTSAGRSAFARLVLRAVLPSGSLAVVSSRLPTALVDAEYSAPLAAVGGVQPYAWSLQEGTLPDGLEVKQSGRLAGTPRQAYPDDIAFTVEVVDASGNRASAQLSLRVVARNDLFIVTPKLAEGFAGMPFRQQLQALGGAAPYTWTVLSGQLPEGLALSEDHLLGTATRSGLFPLVIRVEDSAGRSDTGNFLLAVLPAPARFAFGPLPEAHPGEAYAVDLSTGAAGGSRFALYAGALPPGLALSEAGVLSGTLDSAAEAGSHDFLVQLAEEQGAQALVPLTVRVVPVDPPAETGGCSSTGGGALPWLALLLLAPLARRRNAAGAALAVALLALPAAARAGYTVASSSQTFVPITGTALPIADSGQQAILTLPFPFRFWGVTYQTANVGCLGYVAFAGGRATEADVPGIPSSRTSFPLVAPWWGRWSCAAKSVTYAIGGVAPSRVLTIQWDKVWHKDDVAAHAATFQVRLHEAGGKIEFAYGPATYDPSSTPSTFAAAAGLQHSASLGLSALACTFPQPASGSGATCLPSDYFADTVLTITQPPDLTLPRVWADEAGFAGVPVRLGATVWNRGGRPAAGVAVRFYLSTDNLLDPVRDRELATSVTFDLGIDERREVVVAPRLPESLSEPAYYVFAVADADKKVAEDDERNNAGPTGGARVVLGGPTPDLAIGEVTVPAKARPGETISVGRVIRNAGNALAGPCAADEDCDGQKCLRGRCRPPCGADGACPDKMSCEAESNACDWGTCTSDADCPAREFCAPGGACEARPVTYSLYLSDNPVVSLADRLLGPAQPQRLPGGLAPFAQDEQQEQAALPADLAPGRYYVGVVVDPGTRIAEISEVNNAGASETTLTVHSDVLGFLTDGQLPHAHAHTPYGVQIRAGGGDGSYTFSQAGGELPPGLALSSSGYLSGIPQAPRSAPYSFQVKVQSEAQSATATFTVAVADASVPLNVVTAFLPAAEGGAPYQTRLAAVGGEPPYTWRLSPGGDLPPGLLLSGDGHIEGVSLVDGTFALQAEVQDSAGASAARPLTLSVLPGGHLQITSLMLPEARLGRPYSTTLLAAGGQAPYYWIPVEARLMPPDLSSTARSWPQQPPPGLILDRESGTLLGVPAMAGNFLFAVKVQDSAGREDNVTFLFPVVPDQGVSVATLALPDGFAGKPYLSKLEARAGEGGRLTWTISCPTRRSARGAVLPCLPEGIALAPDGELSSGEALLKAPEADADGHQPVRETYSFLARVEDDAGRSAVQALSITVRLEDEPSPPDSCQAAPGAAPWPLFGAAAALALAALGRRRRS